MAGVAEVDMTLDAFREIDHSGDVGIEATGGSFPELATNATRGLFGLMYRGEVARSVERPIRADGATLEDVLVEWLGEVISISAVHGELYGEVEILRHGPDHLEGVLRGEPLDAERHDLRFDVKAATYHDLKVEEDGGVFHARVIFDL